MFPFAPDWTPMLSPSRRFRTLLDRTHLSGARMLGLMVGCLLAMGPVCLVLGQPADPAKRRVDRTETEDRPEVFRPRQRRTEADEDLLTSAAHFAQARMYLHRQNEALALRHFQRAWRFNQERVLLLDQIVALASKLRRNEEAARYAVLSAERRPRDARLLIQLGGLLSQQNQPGRALRMYEQAISLQQEKELNPQAVAIRVEMGRLYFINEDYENASRIFAAVRDALEDPQIVSEQQREALLSKPYALYSLMAASFLEAERFDEAAAMFRKANSFEVNAPRLDFHLAEIALRKHADDQARKLLDQYLDSKSTAAGVDAYRVLQQLCQREHPEADAAQKELLAELLRRHASDPENVPLGYFLADALMAADRLDEAEPLYVDLLERQPAADAYTGLATIYLRQQNVPRLLDVLGRVVVATKSLDMLEDEITKLVAADELVKQLFELARRASQESAAAERLAASLAAAHVALAAQEFEEFDAFAALAADAAGDDQVGILEQLGLATFIAEDAVRAADLFRLALTKNPSAEAESTLQYYLAGAAQYAGDTEAALAAAQRAAELREDSPRFAGRRPWILYQAKQHDRAEQEYLQLIEKYEANFDSPGARDVLREARLILSNIEVERQRFPLAEEWLAQVLDEFPEDIGAKNDLGYLWVDQGQHLQRATRMIQQAVEAEPDNIAYRDSLGWAYYRLGRFADAIKELQIATAGDEPDGVILDHLGDAHAGEKQTDQAVATWRRALSAFRKANQTDRLPAIEAKIKQHSQN